MRSGRKGLLRNAAVVAANRGCVDLIPQLTRTCSEDSSGLVRQHALWALSILQRDTAADRRAFALTLARAARDPEPNVRRVSLPAKRARIQSTC